MASFFITGAGTGVGKTLVTCVLAHQLCKAGKAVKAYKPVLTGFDAKAPEQSDTAEILKALGEPITLQKINALSPYRYTAPLSPHIAAQQEQTQLPYDDLIALSRRWLTVSATNLIEGVGGVLVPLDWQHTVRDWIATLRIPAILVGGSYVGSINHTLTAVESLRHADIPLQAIIVSASEGDEDKLEDTVASLRQFIPEPPPIMALPRIAGWQYAPDMLHLLHA